MLFTFITVGALLGGLYSATLPSMYTSTTTLMPPDNASSSSNLLGLLSMSGGSAAASVGSSLLGVRTPGALFVAMLGSRTVQESMVTRFDLIKHYRVRKMEEAVGHLSGLTHAFEDPKNGMIHISVDDRSPELATQMAAAYVDELNRVVVTENTSAARRERIFLEERLREIKQDLDDSSKALSQFSSKTHSFDVPSEARSMVDAGLRLQGELGAARSELAGLRQIYADDNVRVKSAAARVQELQGELNQMTGFSKSSEDDAAQPDNSGRYPSLQSLPKLGVTYAELERRVVVEQSLWEALTKQYEAAKVQEAKEIPTVRVLDKAEVPDKKSYPVRRNIVLLGALLGLFAACALIAFAALFEGLDENDDRMRLARDALHRLPRFMQRFLSTKLTSRRPAGA